MKKIGTGNIPPVITCAWLRLHKKHIFVFGDNIIRKGTAGQASCRNEDNTYGFITKKYPNLDAASYYKPEPYKLVFKYELEKLTRFIIEKPQYTFLIPTLGSGLANRFNIYEQVIRDGIQVLRQYPNVVFLEDIK